MLIKKKIYGASQLYRNSLRACFEHRNFFLLLRFSCENELFPVKFLRDSYEIPAF